MSGDIWTHDLMFQTVNTIEQALWHLKAMRGGISATIGVLSQKKGLGELGVVSNRNRKYVRLE